MKTTTDRELGDLGPIRAALEEIAAWEDQDRDRRGEDDAVVRALAKVRLRLGDAIADAENPDPELSIQEYAKLEGIGLWAAYKRFERGQIPGATKRPGKGIVIPMDYDDRAVA